MSLVDQQFMYWQHHKLNSSLSLANVQGMYDSTPDIDPSKLVRSVTVWMEAAKLTVLAIVD